jgi:hypothetical protein
MDIDKGRPQPSLWRQALRMKTVGTLTEEEIAARAYAKYCGSDNAETDPVKNWLAAERELLEERIVPRG